MPNLDKFGFVTTTNARSRTRKGLACPLSSVRVVLILLALLFDLVLDGLLRRICPSPGGDVVLFFVKDVLCVALWVCCLRRLKRDARVRRWVAIVLVCLGACILPSFLLTGFHDSWLAFFGLKQRLLPLGVALAVVIGTSGSPSKLTRLEWAIAVLLLGTGILAVWQTYLPVEHWLNRMPEGNPLPPRHIKAGIPRVSSTFPFFGQYAYFLLLALPVALGLAGSVRNKWLKSLVLLASFGGIAGAYAANSRTAVFGPLAVFCFVAVVQLLWRDWQSLRLTGTFLGLMLAMPFILDRFAPQAIAGYHYRAAKATERSGGNLQDLALRMTRESAPSRIFAGVGPNVFGGRLGSQSHGTERFSRWASEIRHRFGWAENPLRAVFLETGWWGMITGGLARLALIAWLGRLVLRFPQRFGVTLPLFGTVVLIAVSGSFDFQFPLACWLWLAVGLLVAELWRGGSVGDFSVGDEVVRRGVGSESRAIFVWRVRLLTSAATKVQVTHFGYEFGR